ncbi:MAG: RluA family pseudouridine synthase, partial [Patescibacteria group bacterium]
GLLVHGPGITLVTWLLENYPEIKNVGDDIKNRPGIVHRLDRETSGLILVPLNKDAYEYFKRLFQNHQIKKTYIALVYGIIKEKEGLINKPLGIKHGSLKRTVFTKNAKMIKEAITRYKVRDYISDKYSLLEVEPLTGRTHQIRVHLASIGHPIVGDKLYGKKNNADMKRHFLHAESLEFSSPDGKRLKVAADLPDDLQNFLTSKRP